VRKTIHGLMVAALLTAPAVATATPVQYLFEMGPTYDGLISSGSASFYWDTDTHMMSELTWDLGEGRVGSVPDSTVDWSQPALSTGTLAEFTFEILTGLDTWAGGECGGGFMGCGVGFAHYDSAYPNQLDGWPFVLMGFGLASDGLAHFDFYLPDSPSQVHSGTRTLATVAPTPPTDVLEPGTVVLLGAGALGLVFRKRRRI